MSRIIWVGLLLGFAASVCCYFMTGATLGFFFGGIIFTTLLLPPLCLTNENLVQRVLIAAAVCDGVAMVWLIAWINGTVSLSQWLLCYAVLIVWSAALLGVSSLMARKNFILASAGTVFLALIWLAWPIWSRGDSSFLVKIHPLLVLNSILANLGLWSESHIAYRYLMTLGQDVPYQLPQSILPAILVYSLIGLAGLSLGRR